MDIIFYSSFNKIGQRLILVHRTDILLQDLPSSIQDGFDSFLAQKDKVDLSDLSSRWWLCPETVDNLKSLGYDRFKIVRG
ncbi:MULTISPECIES: hypothetical protein [Xanthomonas]|uniref:hypothetical protein n=1 Tax=Xanthomonas TaxID=338 RepID=UPI000F8E1AC4|nr:MULTISPECIES: hypothetical protein [Xanthomonas]